MGSAKCYGVQAAVNEIEITKVILNRGNWEFRPRVALPVSLKFGQVLALDSQDCSLLEAHIQTDQGTWEFSLGDDSRMHPIQFQSQQITEVIEGLATALELYRLDIVRFPSTSEGLQALTVAPNGGHQVAVLITRGKPADKAVIEFNLDVSQSDETLEDAIRHFLST